MFEAVLLNDETWLICGGRNFSDNAMFDEVMGDLMRQRGCPTRIVHGGARGADAMAGEFARRMSVDCVCVPAMWELHGRAAGHLRNQGMIDKYKPALVVAFPGGKGTADMMARARKANVAVAEIKHVAQEENTGDVGTKP